MSDSSGNPVVAPTARDIGERAANWVQRREFWMWTEQDAEALEAWLAESLAHRIAYTRTETAWKRTTRVTALRTAMGAARSAKHGWLSQIWVRTAAALIFVTAVGFGMEQHFRPEAETIYSTAVGERETITLADGSRIELNTDTTLRASGSASRRRVTLAKGEAFFDIKHDSANPFAVIVGNHRITDLGTKFLVRSEPNRLEVALVEGRAAFDAAGGRTQPPIVLAPGDSLVVADNQIRTTRKTSQTLSDELGWRYGMLVFENTSLGEAADQINRYNAQKVIVADASTAKLKISATFPTNGIEDFVQMAHALLGLRVEHRAGEVVISR